MAFNLLIRPNTLSIRPPPPSLNYYSLTSIGAPVERHFIILKDRRIHFWINFSKLLPAYLKVFVNSLMIFKQLKNFTSADRGELRLNWTGSYIIKS